MTNYEAHIVQDLIDCKDKMPKMNQPVLTFDGHCFAVERRIEFIDTEVGQIEGEWWINGYEGDEFNPIGLRDGAVIKWMPLPEIDDIR